MYSDLQGVVRFTLLVVYLTHVMTVSSTVATRQDPLPDPLQKSIVDESCLLPDGGKNTCDTQDKMSSANDDDSRCINSSPSNAVVLYRPTPLEAFRQKSKQFRFGGREIVIKQKWEDLGVAAVVWDAAVVLAEFLEKNKFPLSGKSVIELGAGTGLVSMVAALFGAHVIATDRKLALEFLQENIQENLSCPKSTEEKDSQHQEDIASDKCVNIEVRELDWGENHMDFAPTFDYILGADIIYLEKTFEQLLETLIHLGNSDRRSKILLSCRIRYKRDVGFIQMMKKHFSVKEMYYDEQRDIKVYKAEFVK